MGPLSFEGGSNGPEGAIRTPVLALFEASSTLGAHRGYRFQVSSRAMAASSWSLASVWKFRRLLWRPLARLAEEARQQRIATEQLVLELRALRQHFVPDPQTAQPEVDPIEFTTDLEQVTLQRIWGELEQAKGGTPPTEDEVIAEYTRQLETHARVSELGSVAQRLYGRQGYGGGPLPPRES